MSQEYNSTLRKSRRTRSQRNRPVLVTSSDEITTEEQAIQETAPAEEIEETPAVEPEAVPTSPAKGRRLPNFFSTVGKSEKEDNQKETDVVQARLARATKGKASTTTAKTAAVTEEKNKETPKSETRAAATATSRTRPAQQQGAFKTRYILGIAIYLFAANFIGTGITLVLRQMHADVVLTQFNLFGGKVVVSSSTLLFLALLIIILVLLARFDLIPRSLAPTSQNRAGTSKSSETVTRQPPSPIRQGVKGEDDDLYQEYRLSQRRSKKR
jgi:hypothetical protein